MDLQREPFNALELEVDLAQGEVRYRGRRLDLPPRALEVLALLVGRHGQLVRYEEIRKALWKDGLHVDFGRNIHLHVNRLRKAFEDDARAPRYIETVPRQGYRFIAPVNGAHSAERLGVAVLPFENLGGNSKRRLLCRCDD